MWKIPENIEVNFFLPAPSLPIGKNYLMRYFVKIFAIFVKLAHLFVFVFSYFLYDQFSFEIKIDNIFGYQEYSKSWVKRTK